MPKIASLIIAMTLAGCASTRQERAAAFQQELPQLVVACNGWIQADPRLDGPTIRRDGLAACNRLAVKKSLNLADPAAVSAYQNYKNESLGKGYTSSTLAVPMPLPQVQ
jgi:hypothetical protein